ncbi:uncharacterized protein TNCV_880271 [Trichonephila clavipes]|nr:uncharacterized protein TNCV_880271 [Trichonephila clavipes]
MQNNFSTYPQFNDAELILDNVIDLKDKIKVIIYNDANPSVNADTNASGGWLQVRCIKYQQLNKNLLVGIYIEGWAVGSLVVRASDSQTGRPGFDARCHQIPSECTRSTCSLNQWVRSLVGLFTSAGTGEYFPPLLFTYCRNCGGGDRGRVAIYRPFGEVSLSLNRTVTCMVLKVNDRRTSCPCHDEFRGPRSDYVRQVALATTTTTGFVIARKKEKGS